MHFSSTFFFGTVDGRDSFLVDDLYPRQVLFVMPLFIMFHFEKSTCAARDLPSVLLWDLILLPFPSCAMGSRIDKRV